MTRFIKNILIASALLCISSATQTRLRKHKKQALHAALSESLQTHMVMPATTQQVEVVTPATPVSTPEPAAIEAETFTRVTPPVEEQPSEQELNALIAPEMMVGSNASVEQLLAKGNEGFNEEARKKEAIKLVMEAVTYFQSHTIDESFDAFSHSPTFSNGELALFVLDNKGNVYVSGDRKELVWKNIWDTRDEYNTPITQEIIRKASIGEHWAIYSWRNATTVAYIQQVIKDGVTYVIGTSYFPHSKADQVIRLVRGAVGLFNELVIKQKYPPEEAFSSYSYPAGRFVIGDLYVYVLDFNGVIYAQPDRPGLIGSNAWNYQDASGKFTNQEIINKLKAVPQGTGIWVKYFSKGAPKLVYAEKVMDNAKKEYFIACGYYPTVTREKAIDLVKRGYEFMKRQGRSRTIEEFSSKRSDAYRYGDLSLVVFDTKGKVIVFGDNRDLVDVNLWDVKDEDGVYFVREIIKKAQEGGGWVNFRMKNSFESAYVEPIELGLEKYVISTGLYPVSKQETTLLLVRSAASLLRTVPEIEALRSFTTSGGPFIRGDLFITVWDSKGICLASGDNYSRIWTNMINAKDDNGKPFVRLLINAVKRGPAQLTFTINGATYRSFAEQVERDGRVYVVSSGYFI